MPHDSAIKSRKWKRCLLHDCDPLTKYPRWLNRNILGSWLTSLFSDIIHAYFMLLPQAEDESHEPAVE